MKYKELGELVTAWFLHTRDDTATRLANWWAPGMSDLNQCETKMVEKIIVDWKAKLSWIDVDVEDVAAGSAMHYALKNINK